MAFLETIRVEFEREPRSLKSKDIQTLRGHMGHIDKHLWQGKGKRNDHRKDQKTLYLKPQGKK